MDINYGVYTKLKDSKSETGIDLEVRINKGDGKLIHLKTDIYNDKRTKRYDIGLTIKEIEALYHYSQLVKGQL